MKEIKINKAAFWGSAFFIITSILSVMLVLRVIWTNTYRINVTQHIENAGKAATVEVAIEELETALSGAKKYGMTTGRGVIFDQKNAIDFYYKNMNGFLESLKNFEAEVNPDIYQVELNALQERMGENIAPYGISYRSKVVFTIYKVLWILEIITVIGGCIIYEKGQEEQYYTIRLPQMIEEVDS